MFVIQAADAPPCVSVCVCVCVCLGGGAVWWGGGGGAWGGVCTRRARPAAPRSGPAAARNAGVQQLPPTRRALGMARLFWRGSGADGVQDASKGGDVWFTIASAGRHQVSAAACGARAPVTCGLPTPEFGTRGLCIPGRWPGRIIPVIACRSAGRGRLGSLPRGCPRAVDGLQSDLRPGRGQTAADAARARDARRIAPTPTPHGASGGGPHTQRPWRWRQVGGDQIPRRWGRTRASFEAVASPPLMFCVVRVAVKVPSCAWVRVHAPVSRVTPAAHSALCRSPVVVPPPQSVRIRATPASRAWR